MASDDNTQEGSSESLTQDRRVRLGIAVGLLAVLLFVGVYSFWPRPQPAPAGGTELTDDPSLGPASAPVTVVEYGDFGCPACKTWHAMGVQNQIQAKYGDKVRWVWRDFAVITPQSRKAAEAARCAYDQGKFWEYHDLLFARQPALAVSDLKAYAAQMGLDTVLFDRCLDSGRHFEQVARGLRDGMEHGLISTPGFLVNNQPIAGGPPLDYMQSLIDPILASGQ